MTDRTVPFVDLARQYAGIADGGTRHGVGVASGMDALHFALRACGDVRGVAGA